jgi:putative oxidoreductase
MEKESMLKKVSHIVVKVLLTFLLLMPILGLTGIFPEPTQDMYNSEAAFTFIQTIMQSANYIQYIMVLVFVISAVLLWTKREALSAILIAPITINIVGFHLFLDGGLLTSGAIMGNILLALNIYLFWKNKNQYNSLLKKHVNGQNKRV